VIFATTKQQILIFLKNMDR